MSKCYPSSPQSNSDHGSVCDIDDLFDIAAFDDAIRDASATSPTVRSKFSDSPSSSNPDQATYGIFCDNEKFHTHTINQTQSEAATTDSINHVNVSEESMAELLERFFEQDRLEERSVQQDKEYQGIIKNRDDRVLDGPNSAQQRLKRSYSEGSNVKSSTSVKRVRSDFCPSRRPYRQLRPRKHQLQAQYHAHVSSPLPTRAKETLTVPMPTNDGRFNMNFDYWGAAHVENLSMPMLQSDFANGNLGHKSLPTEFSELSRLAMPDTTTALVPDDWQEVVLMKFLFNAYEPIAPPMFNIIAAELSPEPLYLAPAIAHNSFQEPTDNDSLECMCCNALTNKSAYPAYFGIRAAVLPLCAHFVCHTCITRYYDLKGEYNSCIYCPMCDSFSGSLAISDTSLPTLSRDLHYLLYKTRRLPQECFANQPVSIDAKEASVVLRSVFKIVAGELGSDAMFTTASLPADRFYTSLDTSLQSRRRNDVTSPEDLRAVLLECIETRAVDELGRCYGRVWLRSQFGHRRQTYRWHELKAALERNWVHGTELQVMQAWTSIVYSVVGVLTLRWEHRLDAMLSSASCSKTKDQTSGPEDS